MNEMEAGRELDRFIAERVMGWRWFQWPGLRPGFPVMQPPEQWGIHTEEAVAKYAVIDCDDSPPDRLPHYSTDISAAWEVVEKLTARGFQVTIERNHAQSSCRVLSHPSVPCPVDAPWPEHSFQYADTQSAPLVICRAALEAISREAVSPKETAPAAGHPQERNPSEP